jgi:hypothetical protein
MFHLVSPHVFELKFRLLGMKSDRRCRFDPGTGATECVQSHILYGVLRISGIYSVLSGVSIAPGFICPRDIRLVLLQLSLALWPGDSIYL